MTLGRGHGTPGPAMLDPVVDPVPPRPRPLQTIGEIAYAAFRSTLAARGQPAPEWHQLDPHHRAAMEAAGTAVRRALARATIPETPRRP